MGHLYLHWSPYTTQKEGSPLSERLQVRTIKTKTVRLFSLLAKTFASRLSHLSMLLSENVRLQDEVIVIVALILLC